MYISRNAPSQAEFASLEFDLAATLSPKTEQRDKTATESENAKQGVERLTRMSATSENPCLKTRMQIDEANAQA
jgi:hypothetical protein